MALDRVLSASPIGKRVIQSTARDFNSMVLRVTERSSSMTIYLEKQRSSFRIQGRCARRKSTTVHGLVAVRSSFDDLATRIASRRKCCKRVTFVILLVDDRTWTDFRTGLSDFLIRDLDICFCVEFFVLPLQSIYCACCGENVSKNSYNGVTYYSSLFDLF